MKMTIDTFEKNFKKSVANIEEQVREKIKNGTFIEWEKDFFEVEECTDAQALRLALSKFAESAIDNMVHKVKETDDISDDKAQTELLEDILRSIATYACIRKEILEAIDELNKRK